MTTNPNELQRAIELSDIERQAREDHELQEALNRSRGDIPQTEFDPQIEEAMRRSLADAPEEDDEATLQAVIEASRRQYLEDMKRRHKQHLPSSTGGPAQGTSPSTSNSWSNGGPAQATQSSSAKAINSEIDRAYNDSIAMDRKKEEERIAAEQARAEAEARVQARKLEDQRFIAEFTPQYLNDGDVTIRFEHNGRIVQELKVKVSTPIDLLIKYVSSKYYLDNVRLLFINTELLPGTNLSEYAQRGNRLKIIIEGDSAVGGFKVRNSRTNNINIRKNSKRQNSNRQNSKRQNSKRQNSKRQNSKRQNSKRQNSKRQNSKRQNSKRQNNNR
jgi:hypothetical protein